MFCFASGYGLFVSINKEKESTLKRNLTRIFKLLINFWIVLLLFVGIGVLAGKSEILLGSLVDFLHNFFVLSNSYNGAWWFLQTYIILVFLAPALIKVMKKNNSILLVLVSGFIYLIAYIQRIKHVLDLGDNTALNMFVNAVVLVGTSQLPFITGAVFAKEKICSKLNSKLNNLAFKNFILIVEILLLVLINSLYESMIIAPITGIAFISLFNLIDKSGPILKALDYFGTHSTNLWLTHMFFYMTIFPKLTFAPKYPILIFAWLIILCLMSSYLINLIYKPIINRIDKKSSIMKYGEKAVG